MPEHQQIQQSKKTNTIFQKQATPISQTPVSNPYSIIQRAKINPKSLTHADVMQLQRTIGNRAVGRLLSGIGNTSTAQQATIQRQEIPEEEEPLQGRMIQTIQLQEIPEEEEPLQGKMIGTVQRQEIPQEEEPLQGKFENKPEITCSSCFTAPIVQRQEIPEEEEPLQTKRENNTGMPDNLKAGVEDLSGIDMSDVKVHYNSDKPAEVGALAYTQGTEIHVAPGQERHLSHEAWHVVQQKQGRVKPTMQLKDGVPVNDDKGLEQEANVMGAKAFTTGQDMSLWQGAYEPGSRGRVQGLISHQLTHVVQKNKKTLQQSFVIQREYGEEMIQHLEEELQRQWNAEEKDKKKAILNAIKSVFGDDMVSATKDRTVVKSVLKFVNSRRSEKWVKGTVRKPPNKGDTGKLKDVDVNKWTLRHYTDKYRWDEENKEVKPPSYKEILSALTLAAMEKKKEDVDKGKIGASTSGHTSSIDWEVIGNVGDTFFALFYDGELAGQRQTFLNQAQWYAEWKISDVDEIWASSDWLGKAREKNDEPPRGGAYEGKPEDVISSFLGMMGRRGDDDAKRKIFETRFDNFEVKVHGSLKLDNSSVSKEWIRVLNAPLTEEENRLKK